MKVFLLIVAVLCCFILNVFGGTLGILINNNNKVVNNDLNNDAELASMMAINKTLIESVNNDPTSSWIAGENEVFKGMTLLQVKRLLMGRDMHRKRMLSIEEMKKVFNGTTTLSQNKRVVVPRSYDPRKISGLANCIHPVRNQLKCGGCYAFGATASLSDRFCLASRGAVNVDLSPQYMISCDSRNFGCSGGYLDRAWYFLYLTGVPTESCVPYASGDGVNRACPARCTDGKSLKLYTTLGVNFPYTTADMENDIYVNGPIEIGMTIFSDFLTYRGGVYMKRTGTELGGHAMSIIGWGVDGNNVAYWIVRNSWGPNWGLSGYVWIRKGFNECGIENYATSGIPNLASV
ncbi:hypothetical protein ABK040_014084 [Willaertia magna]